MMRMGQVLPNCYAIIDKDLEKVRYLVEHGADINKRFGRGYTALHAAAYMNFEEAIKYLVENGADVNAKDISGNTAIYGALNLGVVKYLVGHGLDINSKNNNQGDTVLGYLLHFCISNAGFIGDDEAKPTIDYLRSLGAKE